MMLRRHRKKVSEEPEKAPTDMTKAELVAHAEKLGVDVEKSWKKDQILEALTPGVIEYECGCSSVGEVFEPDQIEHDPAVCTLTAEA